MQACAAALAARTGYSGFAVYRAVRRSISIDDAPGFRFQYILTHQVKTVKSFACHIASIAAHLAQDSSGIPLNAPLGEDSRYSAARRDVLWRKIFFVFQPTLS
jgi:hypothetical protein